MPEADEYDSFGEEQHPPSWYEIRDSYLFEYVYPGLLNLNTGFDSPKIAHFSPANFARVIDRCEAMGITINGIEAFDISSRPVEMLAVLFADEGELGLGWAQRIVGLYAEKPNVTLSATFNIPDGLLESTPRNTLDNHDPLDATRST